MKPLDRILTNLYKERNKWAAKNKDHPKFKETALEIEEEIKAFKKAIFAQKQLEALKTILRG